MELLVEATEIHAGGQVTVQLANRGEVHLMTTPGFTIERWDGNAWIEVPFPGDHGFDAVQEPHWRGHNSTRMACPR